MTSVDYSNYVEQQSEWASSLCRVARRDERDQARELGEIAAETFRRTLTYCALSPYHRARSKAPWRVYPMKREAFPVKRRNLLK